MGENLIFLSAKDKEEKTSTEMNVVCERRKLYSDGVLDTTEEKIALITGRAKMTVRLSEEAECVGPTWPCSRLLHFPTFFLAEPYFRALT